jgi:hypothetical protein
METITRTEIASVVQTQLHMAIAVIAVCVAVILTVELIDKIKGK